MSQNLYRKEAMAARKTSLHGKVRLKSPPSTLWLILILLALLAVLLGGIFGLRVDGQPLWQWLWR